VTGAEEKTMNLFIVLVALFAFGYLIFAILNPDRF
jgi:K+-transporting ATPase KdpF subunit